jgi:dCMP deaminase
VKIAQVGISEVVYNQGYLVDSKTAAIFAESGVRLRQFIPPSEGLVDLSLSVPVEDKDIGSNDTFQTEQFKNAARPEDVRQILDDANFVRPL